jgi:hypothetical protein
MSKFAATTVSVCRTGAGWLCAALSAGILLAPACTLAAIPDPILRRSETLDTSRIGKVPETERAVLRVEWRAAVTGADEARAVQEMLDSLRRMETTVAQVNRLVASIRTEKPAVKVAAAETQESSGYDWRLLIANIVAVCLVALWWFSRRNPTKGPAPTPALSTAPEAIPAETNLPVTAAVREKVAEIGRRDAAQLSSPVAPENVMAEPVPTPVAVANLTRVPSTETAAPASPALDAAAASHTIDFLLEEADPEIVARDNARLQKLQALNRRKAPERQKESNVEPTLELAGIMLSLGLAQGAAQTLVEYTEANPREALHHWLKLLDIYRGSGSEAEFKEAAEKLRQNFNIQAEDWARASAGQVPTLENFSRVSEQVQQLWSQPTECVDYLRHLLEDNREGSRAGFPQSVAEEILLLIDILKAASGVNQATGT